VIFIVYLQLLIFTIQNCLFSCEFASDSLHLFFFGAFEVLEFFIVTLVVICHLSLQLLGTSHFEVKFLIEQGIILLKCGISFACLVIGLFYLFRHLLSLCFKPFFRSFEGVFDLDEHCFLLFQTCSNLISIMFHSQAAHFFLFISFSQLPNLLFHLVFLSLEILHEVDLFHVILLLLLLQGLLCTFIVLFESRNFHCEHIDSALKIMNDSFVLLACTIHLFS
jgi:hypothetical protein